jgi:hypothetical protein
MLSLSGKKRVLEEDEYVELLENVIEKNYFPHLSKLRSQLSYLNQHESFDLNLLRKTYNRLFPNLSSSNTVENVNTKKEEEEPQLSVDAFFRKYTSEDNQSFEQIHAKDLQEKRKKYHWMHEALDYAIEDGNNVQEKKAGMLMLYYIGNQVLTAKERNRIDQILAGEKMIGDERPNTLDSWAFRVRNQLMFYPELQDSLKISKVGDYQQTSLPSSTITTLQSQPLLLTENGSSNNNKSSVVLHEFKVPDLPAKKRHHGLPSTASTINKIQPIQHSLQPYYPSSSSSSSSSHSQGKKHIQPQSVYESGQSFTDSIDSYLRGISSIIMMTKITPLEAVHTPTTIASYSDQGDTHHYQYHSKVQSAHSGNGDWDDESQSYHNNNTNLSTDSAIPSQGPVQMTPMPIPGKGLLYSPLMTWGEVAATPLVLSTQQASNSHRINHDETTDQGMSYTVDSVDTGQIQFHFLPQRKREKLAHKLDTQRRKSSSVSSSVSLSTKNVSGSKSIVSLRRSSYPPNTTTTTNPNPPSTTPLTATNTPRYTDMRTKLPNLSPVAQSLAIKLQKQQQFQQQQHSKLRKSTTSSST